MAEKVGEVYIEASIDTAGVIQAGKSISGVADNIEADLKAVGSAADASSDKLNAAGKSVSRFGVELSSADQKLGRFIDLQGRVRETTGRFTTGMLANGESVKAFNQSIATASGEVDRAGGKLSNFGRNASAIGFQLQDIAVQAQAGTSAFVILGQQGSQLAGAFGPSGAAFGAVIAISSAIGGVLYESMKKAGGAMKELPEEIQKQLEEIKRRYEEVDKESKAAFSRVELSKATAEHEKQEKILNNLKRKHEEITETLKRQGKSSNLGLELTEKMMKKAEDRLNSQTLFIEKLSAALSEGAASGAKGITDEFDALENKSAALAAQIQAATLRLTEGELAARKFAAAQVLGLTNAEQLPPEIEKAIEALYRLEEAEKASVDQKKQALATQRQIREEIQAEAAEELKALEAKRKTEADQKRKVTTEFESVQTGIRSDLETPAQKAKRELDERLSVIKEYYGFESAENAKRTAEGIAAETAYQKRITEIKKTEDEQRKAQNIQMAQSAADTFGILADISKEGGKKSFDQWKIFASAQAAISAALAITNALTLPPPFGFIAAGAIGAATAVQIAKINSTQYSGKLYGGPVSAGGMYPVNEDGRPEILQQGSRQYLLPNARGEVISNKDAQPSGGGGGISIHYAPTIYAQQTDFEEIMAGQPEAVLNAVRAGLAAEGRSL